MQYLSVLTIQQTSECADRLVVADGVQLRAEHDGCEGEEEEALQTEEDHQHDSDWRREVAALCSGKTHR